MMTQAVVSSSSNIVDYVYDAEDELWCQVSVKVNKKSLPFSLFIFRVALQFVSVDCKVMIASLFEKLASKVSNLA